MEKMYKVDLSFQELVLLDGKVGDKAQEIIEQSKKEQSIGFDLPVMNEIILKSLKTGKLSWRNKSIDCCKYCDKKYDYYKHTRNSRYHNKGDKDYKRPMYYSGIAFNEGCVTIRGNGDMCSECASKYNVIDKLCSYVIDNNLPIELVNRKDQTRYVKDDVRICYECGCEMQESKMGKLPAIMGGYYPGACPHCGAKSLPFGRSHKTTDKFVMLPVKPVEVKHAQQPSMPLP